MKKLLFLSFFLFVSFAVKGQDVIGEGNNFFQFGAGLGDGIPFEISYEHCLADNLFDNDNGAYGLGAYFSAYNHDYHGENTNYYTLGVKEYLHYQFIDDLDTYSSLMVGLKFPNSSSPDHLRGALGLSVGARYYFTPTVAAYGEIGYGIANISAGISFKF